MNTLPALSQAFCMGMLWTLMQTQPNPSLGKYPTQRDSETETATTQGDRASDKARDQGPWEPRGGLLNQGRGGGVLWASWGKYTHMAIWMRKKNQGVGGGGVWESLQKKRQRVQTSGRKNSSSGKYGGLPEMQGER